MNLAIHNVVASADSESARGQKHAELDTHSALRFITCGSVDDGKSTLIGRLLLDAQCVLQDQLAHVSRSGTPDLAQFTDGLSAEREQGITIDVAWRYFATPQRKFIIGDAPGHEQYTRNMVTAASAADAAVVLVDATKLAWGDPNLALLPQTRRHSLLCHLLRVNGIVFAVNKLDALGDDAARAFDNIQAALQRFAEHAGIEVAATVPISALLGHNVVHAQPGWCGYQGLSLLDILQRLPVTPADTELDFALPVQWVEKFSHRSDTHQGRRIFWGRVAGGVAQAGLAVRVLPSGQRATVAQVLTATRGSASQVAAGHSVGLVLDREIDVSRGDWLLADAPAAPAVAADDWDTPAPAPLGQQALKATVAWLDDTPLQTGRVYWALHGHRWVKARVQRVLHRLAIDTLAEEDAQQLDANAIGHIELLLQEPIAARAYAQSRTQGALVLVDAASHRTAAAVLLN
ncbi:MAG: hypothetical protein OHK0048_12840 [Rhodoferax sp.]